MAESLGAAVLTVSVDDAQLKAGLRAAEQQAAATGRAVEQAFTRTGKPLQTAANGLQFFVDAQGRARSVSGQFLTIAQQQAAGIERIGSAAQRSSSGIGSLVGAFAGLGVGAAGIGFLRGSINAAVELETITKKLSNTLGTQGAGQALSFTKGLSDQLGLSFKTLANSFGSFTAAATAANVPLSQQKDLFSAVSKAAQALGLSNDEINGSLLALQQVAAKGTVSAEELRGQLGERLPIALAAAARGLGITQQELLKLVESGRLTASEFFPALTKGLNELTAGAGGTETAAQNFQKLSNAFDELQTSFGQSILPFVTEQVKNLTGALEGVGVVLRANKLGLGGGAITNAFGIIPDQGAEAVGALKALQTQFSLTEQQSNALFTDAVASVGASPNAFGQLTLSAEQFKSVLEKLPSLAEAFRAKNKDVTGELNAQAAAAAKLLQEELKRRDSIQNIQEKIKSLTGERIILDVNSTRFQELGTEIANLQERLRLLQQTPLSFDSVAGLRQQLSDLEASQIKLSVDSSAFTTANQQILETQNALEQLDGKKAIITVQQINEGVQNGSLTNNFNNLEKRAQAAQQALNNAAFGSDEFNQALRAAREANFELDARRKLANPDRSSSNFDDSSIRSFQEMQKKAAEGVSDAFSKVQGASLALADAQKSYRAALEGSFDLLASGIQADLVARAKRDIAKAGVFDAAKISRLSERELVSAGAAARGISEARDNVAKAQTQLIQTNIELKDATLALAQKDWQVNVAVNANTGNYAVNLG